MAESLRVALDDGVLRLTLNRPEKRNALDRVTIRALGEALERADLDAAVRVVTLAGEGKDFCAGADLAELLASVDRGADANAHEAMELGGVFLTIRELPKPVVALVHGRALAGGCGLATACDLVIAHADAQFGYPEVNRGFVPAMVMAMLRRSVGEPRAFDLVATGRVLSAADAERIGLIARVLPAADYEAGARAVVRQLAETSATALALIKRQLYQLDGMGFADGIRLGAEVNAMARSTPDFAAAVRKFLDK